MIRVANAPCSWGVIEFDRETATAAYPQVLDEIRASGYTGTELGDWGFMPTDPARLREEVAARGLQLIAAFVPAGLARRSTHARGVQTALRTARLLREAGGADAVIVLSDDNGSVPARERHAGRIDPSHAPTPAEWAAFAEGVDLVARAVSDGAGLRTVFHPHCGGYVETPAEIDQLMARTDPRMLGLCLDTGHIVYGGGDPIDVLERHAPRVRHVHFKDCDPRVAAESRRAGRGYLETVRAQLFCELGAGGVDFGAVVAALRRHRYDGWIVIEQDVFPGCGTPLESARRSRGYLRTLGL